MAGMYIEDVLRAIDLGLRILYVLAAPIGLALAASAIPMTGVVIGVSIATVIALVGPARWRASVEGVPVAGKILGGFGKLGEFYEQHPPKPLFYYVLFPVFAPYWLFWKVPRTEMLLYRKLNAISFIVIIATAVREYLRAWSGIPVSYYVGSIIGMVLMQIVVTAIVMMPIVTTLVMLHARGNKKIIAALVGLGVVSAGLGWYVVHRKHRVPVAVISRAKVRARLDPTGAAAALVRAQAAASAEYTLSHDKQHAKSAAWAAVQPFYSAEEAEALVFTVEPTRIVVAIPK